MQTIERDINFLRDAIALFENVKPKRTYKKRKPVILSLHAQGYQVGDIVEMAGVPPAYVRKTLWRALAIHPKAEAA